MTTIQTDLSRKPYYDDFNVENNYYKILYRPGVAVQAREMNQMQTILQDQVDKFGRFVFKDGSIVEGCSFVFDNNYTYVKIKDTYANSYTISNISDFANLNITNQNGLSALVVNTVPGYESQNPNLNTLYVKYLNSGTYANGTQQLAFSNSDILSCSIGNVTVATVANSTGKGYAFTTTDGTIFKKGFFIRVEPQTLIINNYSNVPDNVSIGFDAVETIITPEIDTTLLDNAAGSANYSAPGAHRLMLTPQLVTRTTSDISNTTSFFSICDFKNGLPVSIKNDPQLSVLGKQMAQRTYETNGNYVVNPFILSVDKKYDSGVANTTYLNLVSSPGIGYVNGYRVEFINNNTFPLRKGVDYQTTSNQIVSSNFGYYFNCSEFCGDFNNEQIAQIEIHNIAKTAITSKTFLSTAFTSSTKIGTAYCRGVSYSSGTPGVDATYRIYIFNIQMLSGYKISQARSLILNNGSSAAAVADIILQYDSSFNQNIAVIQDAVNELMLHPFGQKAMKQDGFSGVQYVYRNKATASFQLTGNASITLPSAAGTGSEQFLYTGLYSPTTEASFIVIPTTTGYSSNKTGTVSVSNTTANVTGSSTTFLSDYVVGDYMYTSSGTGRITTIANNTFLTFANAISGSTASSLTHQKTWPAGVPINFLGSQNRTISATSTVATISLGETANATFQSAFYFDVLRSNTKSINKNINKSTLIKIQVSNNASGSAGPWCLGVPDVLKINNVWVGNGTYSNTNPDKILNFQLDNGQRDAFYNLAYLVPTTPVPNNATILISVDNFTFDASQGVGFFTANSYPVDDANTANTTAIQTYQIPQYITSYGTNIDLRDSVDFRPYAANTANSIATNVSTATLNPTSTLTLYTYGANGSYLPSPDSNFQSTIQHYLPRLDRVSLTTGGEIIITEGLSSNIPTLPTEIPGTMTIGTISMSPYPSLKPSDAAEINRYDYSVQTTMQQTKRYTMADIGKISNRVDRLEYYTSLSLLEQSASSLLVRSSTTGQNRFKNGILVDPFKDHSIGNTLDTNYKISIDSNRGEARPLFRNFGVTMQFDNVASTAVKTGDIVTLPYISVVEQQQPYASKYRNCIEGNIYTYRGNVILDPPASITPDITVNPDIVSSLDLSSNWINMANYMATAWGTQWGAWTNVGQSSYTNQSASYAGSTSNPDGSITQNYQTQTTTTIDQQQQRIGQQLNTTPSNTIVDLGQFVTNVSILPYVKSMHILFKAYGMKPNTRLYAYFNSVPVSGQCVQITPYFGAITYNSGIPPKSSNGNYVYGDSKGSCYEYSSTGWGSAITADSNGNVYGLFYISDSRFTAGDLEFKLTDISNLTQGESAVTTQATAMFFASPLSVQKSSAKLQVRSETINIQEVTQNQNIQQNYTSYSDFTQTIPAPISYPYYGSTPNWGYCDQGNPDGDSVPWPYAVYTGDYSENSPEGGGGGSGGDAGGDGGGGGY